MRPPYFERLRKRAWRASAVERAALWQRYMERITRADLRFGTCGALCLVYAGTTPIAMGLTTSVSGWEIAAEQLRRGYKAARRQEPEPLNPFKTTARTGRVAPKQMAMPESRSGRPGAAVALLIPG